MMLLLAYLGGLGDALAEDLDFDVAEGRAERDRHDVVVSGRWWVVSECKESLVF